MHIFVLHFLHIEACRSMQDASARMNRCSNRGSNKSFCLYPFTYCRDRREYFTNVEFVQNSCFTRRVETEHHHLQKSQGSIHSCGFRAGTIRGTRGVLGRHVNESGQRVSQKLCTRNEINWRTLISLFPKRFWIALLRAFPMAFYFNSNSKTGDVGEASEPRECRVML